MRMAWALGALGFLSGCAAVPSDRPHETPPSALQWFHRPAGASDPEAALWGLPDSEALLLMRCARGGAEIAEIGGDRPTTPWRIAVGSNRMTADPRYEADGYGIETADIPGNHPLLAALADTGGPLRLSTAAGEMTLPASPIVARVVAACRR